MLLCLTAPNFAGLSQDAIEKGHEASSPLHRRPSFPFIIRGFVKKEGEPSPRDPD